MTSINDNNTFSAAKRAQNPDVLNVLFETLQQCQSKRSDKCAEKWFQLKRKLVNVGLLQKEALNALIKAKKDNIYAQKCSFSAAKLCMIHNPDENEKLKLDWNEFLESVKEHPKWTLAFGPWKHTDYEIKFKTTHNKGKSPMNLLQADITQNLDILWNLGNPLVKEKDGGLTLANINKFIKNSGSNHTKKQQCPPIFFVKGNKGKGLTDNGRIFSNALKRLWSIVNE